MILIITIFIWLVGMMLSFTFMCYQEKVHEIECETAKFDKIGEIGFLSFLWPFILLVTALYYLLSAPFRVCLKIAEKASKYEKVLEKLSKDTEEKGGD